MPYGRGAGMDWRHANNEDSMKKGKHKARGPQVATLMRLTPANHKFMHKESAKQGVTANFYINQLLISESERVKKKKK
jgi:hypothetical protein